MQRILDFQSFLNEGYMNEADTPKDIVVRIGNEIGKEGEDTKNDVLYIDLSDLDVIINKVSSKANKKGSVTFGSKKLKGDKNDRVWIKSLKIPLPEGESPNETFIASNPAEAKQKAYNILVDILVKDQVGDTFRFQPERAKQILKELFMVRKNPKAAKILADNPSFSEFLKGIAMNSNETGTIASSLGEYKNVIDPKKMGEIFTSAMSELNK